ncbi:MAG: hypothetical protein MUP03_07455, partial [Anaerolineales bacterium]|nr:hypothetical protein [Anaerolineales bacterium]
DEFARHADFPIPGEDSFAVERGDALGVGSAVHLIFQHLPLTGSVNETIVRQTIAQLSAQKQIPITVAEKIDIPAIISFFQTEVGRHFDPHVAETFLNRMPESLVRKEKQEAPNQSLG